MNAPNKERKSKKLRKLSIEKRVYFSSLEICIVARVYNCRFKEIKKCKEECRYFSRLFKGVTLDGFSTS